MREEDGRRRKADTELKTKTPHVNVGNKYISAAPADTKAEGVKKEELISWFSPSFTATLFPRPGAVFFRMLGIWLPRSGIIFFPLLGICLWYAFKAVSFRPTARGSLPGNKTFQLQLQPQPQQQHTAGMREQKERQKQQQYSAGVAAGRRRSSSSSSNVCMYERYV